MIVWYKEFEKTYRVPRDIEQLVFSGVVEDMSWRNDPCPSFGRRLKDKNWVRVWIEHPDPANRQGWAKRFTVVIQPEPAIPFGLQMISTNYVDEALTWLIGIIKMKGPKIRFKVVSDGGAA